jgi:universal stress protein A
MLTLRRILVPVDFSECSKAALEYAARLTERLDAPLDVLHVWESPSHFAPGLGEIIVRQPGDEGMPLADFVRDRASKDMDQLVAELGRQSSVKVQIRLETGNVGEVILKAAKDGGYDLIVMGTEGRTGLSHLVLGSVAEKVVRCAVCPVLTIRSPTKTGAKPAEPPPGTAP